MYDHWASVWGNAISISENRPESYNKDLTFRYPIYTQFGGKAVRLTFDNFCGTEKVTFNRVTVLIGGKLPSARGRTQSPTSSRATSSRRALSP